MEEGKRERGREERQVTYGVFSRGVIEVETSLYIDCNNNAKTQQELRRSAKMK